MYHPLCPIPAQIILSHPHTSLAAAAQLGDPVLILLPHNFLACHEKRGKKRDALHAHIPDKPTHDASCVGRPESLFPLPQPPRLPAETRGRDGVPQATAHCSRCDGHAWQCMRVADRPQARRPRRPGRGLGTAYTEASVACEMMRATAAQRPWHTRRAWRSVTCPCAHTPIPGTRV